MAANCWVAPLLKAGLGGVTAIDCNISVPCPVKLTDWGLFVALWVMVSNPVRVPVAVGAKVTLMVQLPFPARVAPQVVPDCA